MERRLQIRIMDAWRFRRMSTLLLLTVLPVRRAKRGTSLSTRLIREGTMVTGAIMATASTTMTTATMATTTNNILHYQSPTCPPHSSLYNQRLQPHNPLPLLINTYNPHLTPRSVQLNPKHFDVSPGSLLDRVHNALVLVPRIKVRHGEARHGGCGGAQKGLEGICVCEYWDSIR